jgi:protein O-mannosyl-transferase
MSKKKNIAPQKPANQPVAPTAAKTVITNSTTNNNKQEPSTTASSSKWNKWIAVALIAVISFATFWNSSKNTFVLDDHGIIKNNKVTKAGISADNVKTIFTTSLRKGDVTDLEKSLYRPMAKLIFAAEWDAYGDNPQKFHFWNIVFYTICCILVLFVCYHAFRKNWIPAFLAALLFSVHPIHSEAVANVKSLDEIIGLIGVAGAMLLCVLYTQKNNMLYLLGAAALFMFGLLGKESAIVALPLIPLFIYYFSDANKKQLIMSSAFMLGTVVIWWMMRHNADVETIKEPSALDNVLALTKADITKNGGYQLSKAIPTVLYIMGYYVYTLFVPYPLSCDYSYATIDVQTFSSPYVWLSLLFFGSIIYMAIKTFLKIHHWLWHYFLFSVQCISQ